MNAIKITCLSLSRGSWPCVSSLLLYHREWLGVMGPTILTGIDLFQKWINSEFQGLRENFRLSLLKRWYLIFLVQRWGEKSGKWEKQDKNSIWIKSGGEFLFFSYILLSDDNSTVKVSFQNSESWDKNMDC